MKPKKSPATDPQMDLFRPELSKMIDSCHGLVKLSAVVDWSSLEEAFGSSFCADNGRPGISTRLMVALHYLKYTFDLSDDAVVKGWLENPYWQYFSGMKWFEHEIPIDPSSMSRWRKRIGVNGAEKLLEETIRSGLQLKAIKPSHLARVNVDTTVQEKHIRFPTDSRLYDRARARLVAAAKKRGIVLRQNYNKLSRNAFVQQSRYARAKQMKRARREQRRLKTFLGRVLRDIARKEPHPDVELKQLLDISSRIFNQKRNDKNKVYSVHEPQVACIAKGKVHKHYEFGSKVSVAVTSRGGWFVGAMALKGNPYDGHTLAKAMEQVKRIAREPQSVFVDQGYRGHDYRGKASVYVDKPRRGRTKKSLWKWMKRRAAVEPSIGHLKQEHRLERCRLKGFFGDQVNAILSAAGMNFFKLLKALEQFLGLFLYFLLGCRFWHAKTNRIACFAA